MLAHTSLNLTEVVWSYEPSYIYLGSPSVLRVPDGSLLVTSDRFGSGFAHQPRNVSVHRSTDNGATWVQTSSPRVSTSQGNLKPWKALLLNFVSGTSVILGVVIIIAQV